MTKSLYRGIRIAGGNLACLVGATDPGLTPADIVETIVVLFSPSKGTYETLATLDWNGRKITEWANGFAIVGYSGEVFLWTPDRGGWHDQIPANPGELFSGIHSDGVNLFAVGTASAVWKRNGSGEWSDIRPPQPSMQEITKRAMKVGPLENYPDFETWSAAVDAAMEGFSNLISVRALSGSRIFAGGASGETFFRSADGLWKIHRIPLTAAIIHPVLRENNTLAFVVNQDLTHIFAGENPETAQPLATLPEDAIATSMTEIDGALYFSSLNGVFRLEGSELIPIRESEGPIWAVLPTELGLSFVEGKGIRLLKNDDEQFFGLEEF